MTRSAMRSVASAAVLVGLAFLTACTSVSSVDGATPAIEPTQPAAPGSSVANDASDGATSTPTATPSTTVPPTDAPVSTAPPLTRPDWLGTRVLITQLNGIALPQPTPPELSDRRLPTIDLLPAPGGDAPAFASTIEVLAGEPLERSTWEEGCPVPPEELRYATVTFWGFDGRPHTGELIIAADQAEGIVGVFEQLYEARFPLEEMRIITQADLDADPTGDSNNTGSFVCRAVTGGSRFSEHAYGLAIDVNPFHNPYIRGPVVLPELASDYLDRDREVPGMIQSGDVVVEAFAAIGWRWGGNWNSLKDWQHFALNNR